MVVDPQFLAARAIGTRSAKPVVATFSVRTAFHEGWEAAKGRYGLVLGTVVVVGMITIGAGVVANMLDLRAFGADPAAAPDVVPRFTLFAWLVGVFIMSRCMSAPSSLGRAWFAARKRTFPRFLSVLDALRMSSRSRS